MVTFVGAGTSTSGNVAAISGLSWPAHAAADLALGIWALILDPTPTLDSLFTQLDNQVDQNLRSILFDRLPVDMTGSESGAITGTTAGTNATNRMAMAVSLYRGCSGIGTSAYAAEGVTAVTSHTSPNVTLGSSADGICLLYAERQSLSASTITAPAGYTIRGQFGTGGSGGTVVCIADLLTGNSAGSNTVGTWSSTNAASNVGMYAVPLTAIASDGPHYQTTQYGGFF